MAPSARPREHEAVARERLSTLLDEAWLEAEQARGHALLLSGEEGSGKSAALQQLAAVARRRGAICWFARGAEVNGAPAYWPFVTVLRDALQMSWMEVIVLAMVFVPANLVANRSLEWLLARARRSPGR